MSIQNLMTLKTFLNGLKTKKVRRVSDCRNTVLLYSNYIV